MKQGNAFLEYWYELPLELIAKAPAPKRDESRLFVYDTKTDTVTFDIFKNIGNYLPDEPLMVFNDTKVVPARVEMTKVVRELRQDYSEEHPVFAQGYDKARQDDRGGKVEVLFLVNEYEEGEETIR